MTSMMCWSQGPVLGIPYWQMFMAMTAILPGQRAAGA